MSDIEDLGKENFDLPNYGDPGKPNSASSGVGVKVRKRNKKANTKDEKENPGNSIFQWVKAEGEREGDEIKKNVDSFNPEKHSVYLKTWGCTHNSSDSEYMAGILKNVGYSITSDRERADLWILNSCTVKSPSEDHFRNEIESGKKADKSVIVAGCVPQGKPDSEYLSGLSVIGVQQIDRVAEVAEQALQGNSVRMLGAKRENGRKLAGPKLDLPKVRRNPFVEIIPINSGCLNRCTYCKTKHARGDLASYSVEEIVSRASQAFSQGVVEIWLTSEDTGAYGRDIGSDLPSLLTELVKVIPGHARLRVGMTNPPYIMDHLDEIAEILKHPQVYSFLHVPVQSGSDAVLSDMKREYNRDEFIKVVEVLRSKVPGISIATDIICGFPSENEQDFEDSFDLVERFQFPSLFINQFFPRPGTPAASMPRVADPKQVKARTKKLHDLFYSYEPYKGREGLDYEILVTEISHDKKFYVGHNKCYEQILIEPRPELMGKIVKVRVTSTSKFSMHAKILGRGIFSSEAFKALTSPIELTAFEQKIMSVVLFVLTFLSSVFLINFFS